VRGSGTPLFPVGVAALLAALTLWLHRAAELGDFAPGGKRHTPDFVVDNFVVRRFDSGGVLQHTAAAPKMVHYGDDDTTDMSAPVYRFFGPHPMDLSAKRAWIGKDGKEVRLEGDVRLVRAADGEIPETVITSREMYIYPDEEIARSDTPITIARGRSVLSGGAFDADGRRDTLLLKGPVRGTIVPRENLRSR